ncbi:MAG: DUF2779 domain-containing protein, partial [Balneolaceae bacterium]|nr:DUF2779 domain-containing protein [Balneolaceae bacterium]
EMNRTTEQWLEQSDVVIYNASYLIDHLFAKVPVVVKKGQKLDAYFVQTRAVRSHNPNLRDRNGMIRAKWVDYLLEIAFQLLVMERKHPDWKIRPWLVLPNRKEKCGTDNLDLKLTELKKNSRIGVVQKAELADHSGIWTKIPVSTYVRDIREGSYLINTGERDGFDSFESRVMEMASLYRKGKKVATPIGKKCKRCEFRIDNEKIENGMRSGFRECWRDRLNITNSVLDTPHVFDLFGSGTGRMIEKGIYFQNELSVEQRALDRIYHSNGRITDRDRQLLQIQKANGRERADVIMKPQLRDEVPRWQYPLHFIDFEAGSYAIPHREGLRPYDPVVFQFSCHTLKEDGELTHRDWIGLDPECYNNYELVRQLSAIPDIDSGTIIHYSNFERHMLKNILGELRRETNREAARLADWVRALIGRNDSSSTVAPYLVDMNRLVRNYYYNPYMADSLSIKDLLPAVMRVSPHLRDRYAQPYEGSNFSTIRWWRKAADDGVKNPYRLMEEDQSFTIRRGTQAMAAYARLRAGTVERAEREEIIRSLLQYCEMDTLAMVMVYQHWRELLDTS